MSGIVSFSSGLRPGSDVPSVIGARGVMTQLGPPPETQRIAPSGPHDLRKRGNLLIGQAGIDATF